jgi:hypothetical protein
LVSALAPSLAKLVKDFNLDISKLKKDDLIILLLVQNTHLLEKQTNILNEQHTLLEKMCEDIAVLKTRTEKR